MIETSITLLINRKTDFDLIKNTASKGKYYTTI